MECSVVSSYEHCQSLARTTAGNFYYSFLTLPREQRRAMCALYAFMRVTDDLGDSDAPVEQKIRDLAEWRAGFLESLETPASRHPVLPAVVDIVRRYQIPRKYLLDVITGVEMDLAPTQYRTFAELANYCYHVAGAVGLACIHLWGFHDPRATEAAIDCGTAFQLTNILRDLREDALRGRVYLPSDDLDRFEIDPRRFALPDSTELVRDPHFLELMRFESARAYEYYHRAAKLSEYLSPSGRPIFEAMVRIYGGVLDEISRAGYDVFRRRVALSRCRKLSIVGGILMRSWWQRWFRRSS
jgi:15-cis-phytoene synthase